MSQSQIIKSNQLSWLNIINASDKDIDYLRKKFKFNELDLADSSAHKHAQRPKLDIRSNYFFMVIIFPFYNRKTREITPSEIDIFITQDHIITIHYNQLTPLKEFFALCTDNKSERETYLNSMPDMLLYEILEKLYDSLFPMLDHLSLDINNIEKNIFAGRERQMVNEILVVKRNIVYFKKIMQIHRAILMKLASTNMTFFRGQEKSELFYHDLVDHVENIWDTLTNYQQTIDALEDTNSALVTFKLNDIMRTLTIFSVIVFPLTLMAAIFGMNVSHMPFAGSEFDFWKIITVMALASLGMFLYFRHKKWI